MSPTKFSLRSPLAVTAITLALAFFGVYSYLTMGVGIVPNVSFPGVIITTTDPGADPATVETQITKPLEDAISALPNVDTMTSTSSEGVSTISVQFTTAANTELVPVDVERVVNAARGKLPSTADPPSIQTFDTSAIPVMVVALSGPQPLDQLRQLAQDRVQRELEGISGVGSVTIYGGQAPEVDVKVDLDKLQARGLGLNSVAQALQSEQVAIPSGSLTQATRDVNVRLNGLVTSPEQLGDIVISQTPRGPVYVRDVATIDNTFAKATTISTVNGKPAVALIVTKLAAANTIAVSQAVHQKMAQLQPTLPTGVRIDSVFDLATYTRQSFDTIEHTLIEAVILTGLVLLVFLHTWRSTLIVLIAIPTSLLTTFGMMNLLGLDLNLFSMLALTLSVGILVDDSIVVLENIYRHLGLEEPPFVAAINGRSEIGLAAITITMLDVVVYVPIALIPGIAGQFIRPFALVIAAATLTSLVVSFTLTPLLASRFLRTEHALHLGSGPLDAFGRRWEAGFDAVSGAYRRLLHGVLTGRALRFIPRRHGKRGIGMRWVAILVGLLAFVGGLSLLATGRIGFDIFPSGDQSEVDVSVIMPPATSLAATDAAVKQIEQRIHTYKEVTQVFALTSAGSSQLRVTLVPTTERARSAQAIADDMRTTIARGVPGAQVRPSVENSFGFGGFGGQAIQINVRGQNPDVLNGLVDQVTAAVKSVPGAVDVNNSNQNVESEYVIDVNRDQAASLGVTAQQAATALATAINGSVVSQYHRPGLDDVDIRLIADDQFRATPDNLASLPLLTSKGTIVQLGQVGTIVNQTAPTEIDHFDRDRSVTVNASVAGRTPGDVQNDIQAKLARIDVPPGYSISYSGQAQEGVSAFSDIFKAMAISLVLMYMLMMLLFGSVTLPLAVLMSLPLALVGAFGAMAATETPFTLFSLLGFTLLLGLVGKNAVLLVDYTDTLRKRGESRTDALLEAAPTRLRPIVMTTISVLAALAPVAIGVEAGSELLKAAAVVLMGGMLTSTLLTLVFVPAMYTIFDDIEDAIIRLAHRFSAPRTLEPEELEIIGRAPRGMAAATSDGVVSPPPDVARVIG